MEENNEDGGDIYEDSTNYGVGYPVVYKYEYDLETLFETDPDYKDFLPCSSYQNDLTFQELSSVSHLDNFASKTNHDGISSKPQHIDDGTAGTQDKCPGTEPCEAAVAIEANLPTPAPRTMSYWRTFISTALYHPNILAHSDVQCFRELFQLFGSDIRFKNSNFIVDLEQDKKRIDPVFNIRPALPSSQAAPSVTFAHIRDFSVEVELKTCIVKDYSIMDFMKGAVSELVNFIIEYPEALYLETYGFVLDFLLTFGVQSDVIIDAVMRTQRRRIKSQFPASVLILKQANRLGKGKKEFLQRKLLSSPNKRYVPVVPIITEPKPIRHLRNRRSGVEAVKDNRTPPDTIIKNSTSNCNLVAASAATSINSTQTVSLVKNKKRGTKTKLFQSTEVTIDSADKERYAHANGMLLSRKKKRFYHRRDNSLLNKVFSCTLCEGRTFTYKGNLVVHMKKHHPDAELPSSSKTTSPSPLSCPVCLKEVFSKYSFRRHIKFYHPEASNLEPLENDQVHPSHSTTKGKTSTASAVSLIPSLTTRRLSRKLHVACDDDPKSLEQDFPSIKAEDKAKSIMYDGNDSYNELNSTGLPNAFDEIPEEKISVLVNKINLTIDNSISLSAISAVMTQQPFQAAVKSG